MRKLLLLSLLLFVPLGLNAQSYHWSTVTDTILNSAVTSYSIADLTGADEILSWWIYNMSFSNDSLLVNGEAKSTLTLYNSTLVAPEKALSVSQPGVNSITMKAISTNDTCLVQVIRLYRRGRY